MSISATFVMALIAVGLQTPSVAYASATQSFPILVASQTTTFPWKGSDPSCDVRLPVVGRARYGKFTTCPPKRVLVLGDSVALTMGIQLALDQADWGTIVDDAGINGCGFVAGHDFKFMGSFIPTRHLCNIDEKVWESHIRAFRPQAIVVEMGWWDSFPHMVNGKDSSLGQPKYDALVKQGIVGLVHSFRAVSTASIYFLSVPWMQPTGESQPASAASHNEINSLYMPPPGRPTRTSWISHRTSPLPVISKQMSMAVSAGPATASTSITRTTCTPRAERLSSGEFFIIIRQDLAGK